MKKISVLLLICSLLVCLPALAQGPNSSTIPTCNLSATSAATNTATFQLIAAPPASTNTQFINGVATAIPTGTRIEICAVYISIKQAAGAADFRVVAGTGSNCATAQTNVTSTFFGTASVVDSKQLELQANTFIQVPRANAVCLFLSAAPTNAQMTVVYRLRS